MVREWTWWEISMIHSNSSGCDSFFIESAAYLSGILFGF